MIEFDLALLNGDVYVNGTFEKVNLYVKEEKIKKISKEIFKAKEVYDCKNKKVLPGLIDPHVHFKLNLGEFVSADDFDSGSKAAAFGGVTTFIDFLDPIFKNDEFEEKFEKRMKEAKNSNIDYSFHATLGNYKDDTKELVSLIKKRGLTSIKVFTTYSSSNRMCDKNIIKNILKEEIILLSHSENNDLIDEFHKDVASFEQSRPTQSELTEVKTLSNLLKHAVGKLYIVHVSSGETVEYVKKNNLKIINEKLFLESCPQYFYLSKNDFEKVDGYLYLLVPPLRSLKEQKQLKENINLISTIGTDHCPFTKEEKQKYKEAFKIPKGVGGIEYSFLLMYNLFGDNVINKFTINPATIFNLKNKGEISLNKDADFMILDLNKETIIDSGHSNSDYSVYKDIKLKGQIESTILRGKFIVKNKMFLGGEGRFIKREYESD